MQPDQGQECLYKARDRARDKVRDGARDRARIPLRCRHRGGGQVDAIHASTQLPDLHTPKMSDQSSFPWVRVTIQLLLLAWSQSLLRFTVRISIKITVVITVILTTLV